MFDRYSFKARLWPALLAGMPAALALATLLNLEWWKESLVAGAGSIGFMFLLAQVARSLGKQCERRMFQLWGGKPSVVFLRHNDSHFDRHTKARYHANVAVLAGTPMPSPAEELDNPQAAEDRYEAATTLLITATRDHKTFDLLFQENINYGFCRNMYGLKPVGVLLAFMGFLIGVLQLYSDHKAHLPVSIFAALTTVASIVMLAIWLCIVAPDWPRTAAIAYADRLMEASDKLVVLRTVKSK